MRIETTQKDQTFEIKLHERMNFADHAQFRDLLASIRDSAPRKCVFDLQHLASIDSAGLGMLMIAHEESKKGGWDLSLHSPPQHVRKLLQLACMDKILTIS